jgi:hypothetical protein
MDLRYSRELALQRLAKFCRAGFVSVTDFRLSPLKIFAAHEVAALVDPSMATKMTVQFNLFGEPLQPVMLAAAAAAAAAAADNLEVQATAGASRSTSQHTTPTAAAAAPAVT